MTTQHRNTLMAHQACGNLYITPHVFEALRHAGVVDPACMTRDQIQSVIKLVLELDNVTQERDSMRREREVMRKTLDKRIEEWMAS